MAEGDLTFGFSGPALADHTMPADSFVRSIAGLNALLVASSEIAAPDSQIIGIEIVGSLQGGSFGFSIRPIWESLDGKTVTRLAVIGGLLGLVKDSADIGLSVIDLLRSAPDEPHPVVVEEQVDTVYVIVEERSMRTSPRVIELLRDKRVREGLDDFTSPLEREGISELFEGKRRRRQLVNELERPRFRREFPFLREALDAPVQTEWLEVLKAAFRKGDRWRVRRKTPEGSQNIAAVVVDGAFLDRVASGKQKIAARDMLHADFRQQQYFNSRSGPEPLLEIVQVREHLRRDQFRSRKG